MGEIELQKLIVRLIGDGSSFQKMMADAAGATVRAAAQVGQASQRIEAFHNSLTRFSKTALGLLASFGVATSLEGAFKKFIDFEMHQAQLKALIESNGGAVEETIQRYSRFAEEVGKVTTMGKGEVFAALQRAEAMGKTGDEAERLTKISIALSGYLGGEAAEHTRLANMIASGNLQYAKRLLGLQGVKDGTKLVAEVQKRLESGMVLAQIKAESFEGQMTKLGRTFGAMSREVGGVIASVLKPLVNVAEQAAEQFKKLDPATKKVVAGVMLLVLAIPALAPAFIVFRSTVGALIAPMFRLAETLVATALQVIIVTPLWVAWNAAVLVVKATVMLFNIQMFIWQALMGSATVAGTGWALVNGVITATVWLLNAAVAALEVILSPAVFLAAVGTILILGSAFAVVASAVYGGWEAGKALVQILSTLPTTYGPIAAVTGLLGEWVGIIKDVVRAAQVDLPFAWEFLKLGFRLGVAEVKSLWPPLWSFIKIGFLTLWETVIDVFEVRFGQLMARIGIRGQIATYKALGGMEKGIAQAEARLQALEEAADRNVKVTIELAEAKVEAAVKKFGVVAETEEVKGLKKDVETARKMLDNLEKHAKDKEKFKLPKAEPPPDVHMKVHAHVKFDFAAGYGAEAETRIAEFIDSMRQPVSSAGPQHPIKVEQVGAEGVEAEEKKEQLGLLRDIRNGVWKQADKPALELQPAGLA